MICPEDTGRSLERRTIGPVIGGWEEWWKPCSGKEGTFSGRLYIFVSDLRVDGVKEVGGGENRSDKEVGKECLTLQIWLGQTLKDLHTPGLDRLTGWFPPDETSVVFF